MFATTPSAHSKQAMPMFSTSAPFAVSLGALFPGKGRHDSAASTRAASPGSSSSSSEEVSVSEQSIDNSDHSVLACRRGRSVLMLNELVMDLEVLPCRGSPSADSSSSFETASGHTAMCTPCTQQMMSFSPLKRMPGSTVAAMCTAQGAMSLESTGGALANQVADHSMMRTRPMNQGIDASQRSPVYANPIGAAAAGGDASRRNPVGKVSLGLAVIGGDASRRSPPGSTNPMGVEAQMHQNLTSATITGTSPASAGAHCSPTRQDASQRSPAKASPANVTVDHCEHALKAWLSGGASASAVDIVELLYAAAPESYED